jgi:ethanolamine utilization protein EutM
MEKALGIIDAKGLTTAVSALDAATKAADVLLLGTERVIGGPNCMSVSIHITGEVAAVQAAVDAGVTAGNRVGTIISSSVLPRPHDDLDKLFEMFSNNLKQNSKDGNYINNEELSDKEE